MVTMANRAAARLAGVFPAFGRLIRRRPILLSGVFAIIGLIVAYIMIDRLFPPPINKAFSDSMVVTDRSGIPLRAFPTGDGRWRLPADIDHIDPAFIEALIAIEDKRFYAHGGVDQMAVVRAGKSAVQRGRVVSGASTITMQTARLLEPRDRTIPSKLIEMHRAIQLERRLTKKEILELYLTLTPYGGNLEGIRAASWAYFGREPNQLTDDQIALLIALPQSPEVRRPDLRPENAIAARAVILDRMASLDLISASRAEEAKEMPLPERFAFPNDGWHASARVRRDYLKDFSRDALPHDARSTIDAGLQLRLEELMRRKVADEEADVQYAAIAIEIETRAVRAHVGSASRDRDGGWIDLTTSARSPGSTLKPFIYGLAFDDGVALPQTFIEDLPARFNTYRPENFDRNFRGQVRVSDALQHSLNVPAVIALDRIGPERFASALSLSGIDVQVHSGASREPGLALALGGAGMSIQDLGMLYAALGDGGVVKPLVWLEDEIETAREMKGHRFMSEASANRIIDILKDGPTPSGRMPSWLTVDAPEIAFKTGTSYGHRDAWAAGVARGYVVIVWVGRPDGAPRPGQTGRSAALPLLFTVFDQIDTNMDTPGQASDRLMTKAPEAPKFAMANFDLDDAAPTILFPPDDAVLLQKRPDHPSPGFVLSARGQGKLRWFVEGVPVPDDAAGAPIWVPQGPGFYSLAVVDQNGREARVSVRVSDLTN